MTSPRESAVSVRAISRDARRHGADCDVLAVAPRVALRAEFRGVLCSVPHGAVQPQSLRSNPLR